MTRSATGSGSVTNDKRSGWRAGVAQLSNSAPFGRAVGGEDGAGGCGLRALTVRAIVGGLVSVNADSPVVPVSL